VGVTAGSREVPGRNACDRRHTYRIIIIIIIIIIITVCEEGNVTLLWNKAVHADREVTANRPVIIIKSNKEKTCKLIDVAHPYRIIIIINIRPIPFLYILSKS